VDEPLPDSESRIASPRLAAKQTRGVASSVGMSLREGPDTPGSPPGKPGKPGNTVYGSETTNRYFEG